MANSNFHSGDRISLPNVAAVLKVKVVELRSAAIERRPIAGAIPPEPFKDGRGKPNYFWMEEFIAAYKGVLR